MYACMKTELANGKRGGLCLNVVWCGAVSFRSACTWRICIPPYLSTYTRCISNAGRLGKAGSESMFLDPKKRMKRQHPWARNFA